MSLFTAKCVSHTVGALRGSEINATIRLSRQGLADGHPLRHHDGAQYKGILGFAAQPIMRDLKLSPVEFGYLGSSFFLLFAISGIFFGFLADRWPSKHVMTAMAIGWALCLLPVAGPIGFVGLMASRILLGATQGPATGVTHHFLFKWFPHDALSRHRRQCRPQGCDAALPRAHRGKPRPAPGAASYP